MEQFPPMPRGLPVASGIVILVGLVIALIGITVTVIVWWRICEKAGYSGALGLLMLVPLGNVILLLVLAFSTWPIEEEVRRLRSLLTRNTE